jgi:2-dehydro-3-deoxygalactonokinase
MSDEGLIAIDWGTSRFRAYRLDSAGAVTGRVTADDGMSTVAPGAFLAVLNRHCGAWMSDAPGAPVLMAGMVGSRNGWAEAAYAPCPASPASVAAAFLRMSERISIVPGVIARGPAGPDVMRGEETLIFGSGVTDGVVCLPGTHSKWAKVEGGAIVDFATFVTGESFALFRGQSLLGRLAAEPEDLKGFDDGLAAARQPGGLLNRLFQARARVLDGVMEGARVGPYLSGLLIGSEIEGAASRHGVEQGVTIIADGVLAAHYVSALRARDIPIEIVSPERAFVEGLSVLAAAQPSRGGMA